MKLPIFVKKDANEKSKIKKIIGIVFIFIGFLALITPFTPGSWLIFIGLELLGLRILLFDKLKFWNRQ